MHETAAVDASPLILLARADLLSLLNGIARSHVVPGPVADEIRVKGEEDPAVVALARLRWLRIVAAPDVPPFVAAWDLGSGETSVLAWAFARPGTLAVVDDLEARRCAESLGLPSVGTVGIVLAARRGGAIVRARPVLENLISVGMYLSNCSLTRALRHVGE